MPWDVVVEVDAGEGCLAAVVIGAEGEGQRAAVPGLGFEGGDEGAPDAAKTVVALDDEGVQFPDAPVVLRESADPAEEEVVVQGGEGEAVVDDVVEFGGG